MPSSLRSDYPIKTLVTTGPFSPDEGATFIGIRIYVSTYNDSRAEGKNLIKCFDDCGYPKNKHLEKLSNNKYILTLDTDPTFFFGRLHVLLTVGYDPSLF